MVDVVIRHCLFRVVRHGGWSWGGDRGRLVDRATRLFPGLIAERLAECFDGGERDIDQTLQLTVRLRLSELLRSDACVPHVDEQLRAALTNVAGQLAQMHPEENIELTDSAIAPAVLDRTADWPNDVSILQLLLSYRDREQLWGWISGFSETALDLWLDALLDEFSGAQAEPEQLARIRTLVVAAADKVQSSDPCDRLVRITRLYIATELAARFGDSVNAKQVRDLLEDHLEIGGIATTVSDEQTSSAAKSVGDPVAPRELRDALPQRPTRVIAETTSNVSSIQNGSRTLSSVLPWIVLGELQRIGYLGVLAASLKASHDERHATSFAAALALRMLRPPERGWHLDQHDRDTASAFAGAESSVLQRDLRLLEFVAPDLMSPGNAHLATELARGHDPQRPWFISRSASSDGTWLLLDADGALPACLADNYETLIDAVSNLSPSIAWVAANAATPDLMSGLSAVGCPFVTRARPARNESWLNLAHGLWTNDSNLPKGPYRRAQEEFDDLEQLAQRFASDFLTDRPLFGRGAVSALDRASALAAGVGLGSIAWTLWRDREIVDPSLALERFGDLTGDAKITADCVEIRAAVGRRYFDLKKHGFLLDIPEVPWLKGRTVIFPGP